MNKGHILLLVLLLIGIVAGVYLIQNKTNLFSKASELKTTSSVQQTNSCSDPCKADFDKNGVVTAADLTLLQSSGCYGKPVTDKDKNGNSCSSWSLANKATIGAYDFGCIKGLLNKSCQASPTAAPTPTATPLPSPTSTPRIAKRVFVTLSQYDANLKYAGSNVGLGEALSGLDGADKICQSKANAVNLGGTWKAWLSDSNTSAASRLSHHDGQYKLINGTFVADNWNDLITPKFSLAYLLSPINVDERGRVIADRAVWTNTNTNGSIWSATNGSCGGRWAALYLNGKAGIGHSGKMNFQWTSYDDVDCSVAWNMASLYCFEQ